MIPYIIAFSVGILLGIILILFSVLNRKKLPGWCVAAFGGVGVLTIISSALMCAGVLMR